MNVKFYVYIYSLVFFIIEIVLVLLNFTTKGFESVLRIHMILGLNERFKPQAQGMDTMIVARINIGWINQGWVAKEVKVKMLGTPYSLETSFFRRFIPKN